MPYHHIVISCYQSSIDQMEMDHFLEGNHQHDDLTKTDKANQSKNEDKANQSKNEDKNKDENKAKNEAKNEDKNEDKSDKSSNYQLNIGDLYTKDDCLWLWY